MKKAIIIPVATAGLIVLGATGAFAAARAFGRADADAQVTAGTNTCLGKKPTIKSAAAVVMGTEGNDVIVSGYANAEVYGLGGDDTICVYNVGGSAYGGAGRDVIWVDGNEGHVVVGGPGSDVILASNTFVRGLGAGGNNFFAGSDGDDVIYGGGGDDVISGQAGNDSLYGGDGEDWLWGGLGGADTVRGAHAYDD
ncbi:calcium-binding protein [Demequina sp.]|uniref:calcium-binding protein n=1 Tax=Demequina sp. TaxID=2050685 RepID=UPI003D0A3C20